MKAFTLPQLGLIAFVVGLIVGSLVGWAIFGI